LTRESNSFFFSVPQPEKGFLFEIPITVIRPHSLSMDDKPRLDLPSVSFGPSSIKRHFVSVPRGATWAVIRMMSNEKVTAGKFVLHTIQLVPKMVVHTWEHHKMFTLPPSGEYTYSIPVKELHILEVCLAKWWAHIGPVEASLSVDFHGVSCDGGANEIVMHGAEGVARIEVSSVLRPEEILPEIKLKTMVQNFRPHESRLVPLGSRDIIPPGRQIYELQLAYNFSLSKTTEITPNFPLLSNVLYESEFESQLWMLYNGHKQLVASGDAFPGKWTVKVDKEEYVLNVHIRSEQKQVLEKLTDLPMLLSSKLSSTISLDVYSSFDQASTGGKKMTPTTLAEGEFTQIYVAAIANGQEKLMKNYTQGQYLTGCITLVKDELGKKVNSTKFRYILHENPKKDKGKSKVSSSNDASSSLAKLLETIREQKLTWLGKQDPKSEEAIKLFEELKADQAANQVSLYNKQQHFLLSFLRLLALTGCSNSGSSEKIFSLQTTVRLPLTSSSSLRSSKSLALTHLGQP